MDRDKSLIESSTGVFIDLTEKEPLQVLHVDDDPSFLKVAKQCLEIQGPFQVDTVSSVEEALEKMQGKSYDVVVSDSIMYGKDTLEFLKELREKGNNIPFIIFTVKGREEIAIKALNLGANYYIDKTGDPETVYSELAHAIHQAVERKRTEEILRKSEQKFRCLVQDVAVAIGIIDLKGRLTYANKALADLMGYSATEMMGCSLEDFLHHDDKGKLLRMFLKVTLLRRKPRNIEFRAISKDGQVLHLMSKPTRFRVNGGIQGFQVIILDMTELNHAEKALKESEERLRQLIEYAPDAIYISDLNGNFIDGNKQAESLTGYKKEELIGKNFLKIGLLPKKCMPRAVKALTKNVLGQKTGPDEFELIRKDGSRVTVEISTFPIRRAGKTEVIGIARDITEGRKMEEKLSALNILGWSLSTAGSMEEIYSLILDVAEKILGFEFADILFVEGKMLCLVAHRGFSKNLSLKLPLDGDKGVTVRAARAGKPVYIPDVSKEKAYVEGGQGIRSELAVPIKIGDRVLGILNIESKKLNGFDEKDQKLLEILAFHAATAMSNLEHAKNLEAYAREIRESQEKFERLFMDNPEAAIYVDSDFHILAANPRFSELFGYSLDEIKGKRLLDLIMPEDKKEEGEILDRNAQKAYINYDTVRKRRDGTLVSVSISAAPISIEGQPIGYVGVYKDISERKLFEERLSALNIYSQRLNMAESMEEIYSLALDATEKLLGFEIAFFMVVDNDMLRVVDQRGYPEGLSVKLPLDGSKGGVSVKVARTGKSINVPDAEKEPAWVDFWPSIRSGLDVPVKFGHKVLGVIGVDSKSLNAFDEKDQKLLEILASHAATAISNLEYAKNLEMRAREILESQQKFQRFFMNNPEAAVYTDASFHILDVNPRFTKLFGYSLDEIRGKHINSVIVPEDKMEEAVMFDERAGKGEVYQEDTVRMRRDGTLVPVSFSAAPIFVENKAIGHVAMYKDISQLKRAEEELKKTLKKLELMNEKLRVVGGLTRHDVRNKLSAIAMNVYLAKNKLAGGHKALEYLNEIEPITQNVISIFDFAKTYEMLGVEELVYMHVGKTLAEAVSLFSDLKDVKIVNNCSGLVVLADSLLRQVFYNLIDNSLKYGKKVSQIGVYFEVGKDRLRIIYEDNGVGIPNKMKTNLFKEGYGEGTGYGLYMLKKICETYGWTIQETGKPRKGVQFIITIPKIGTDGKENYRIP